MPDLFPLPKKYCNWEVLRAGTAAGRLVGGNLSLVASLCGTPWQIDTTNCILVLEDVGEVPYRIDRMLWQLRNAGLLKKPAAVILGSWKDCGSKQDKGFSLKEIFYEYFGDADYPVVLGFPTGHGRYQATLPLHHWVELDTATMQLCLLAPCVAVETNPAFPACLK